MTTKIYCDVCGDECEHGSTIANSQYMDCQTITFENSTSRILNGGEGSYWNKTLGGKYVGIKGDFCNKCLDTYTKKSKQLYKKVSEIDSEVQKLINQREKELKDLFLKLKVVTELEN